MLHSKKRLSLDDEFIILPYDNKFFKKIFNIFKLFQEDAELRLYSKKDLDANSEIYNDFLLMELKKLIKKADYKYIIYDKSKDEVASFFSFDRGSFLPNSIHLGIVIYNTKYNKNLNFIKSYKKICNFVKKETNSKKMTVWLDKRSKQDSYEKFIKRFFSVKLIRRDQFNRGLFEIPDYE